MAQEACPWTGIGVAVALDDMAYQQVQSCFEICPRTNEHGSFRLGNLASG